MSKPKRQRQPPYRLIVGVLALLAALSRIFSASLQAWYRTLSPHDLTIVKVMVVMAILVGLPLLFVAISMRDTDP